MKMCEDLEMEKEQNNLEYYYGMGGLERQETCE